MSIVVHADIHPLDQAEFGRIAYRVMDRVFAVHNEMGRYFDEAIYRDAVARRVPNSQTEVLIEVRFDDFVKKYYMDLLVDAGAVFELKTVRALGAAHRSQLLNYLLLTGQSHGKLINLHPELVEHEFVNTRLTRADLTAFRVVDHGWKAGDLKTWLVSLLRDVGAGLDVFLYEAAVTHYCGGEEAVVREIEIFDDGRTLGSQKVRLAAPGWAVKVTAIDESGVCHFEGHTRRFLDHTKLKGFHWINVTREVVSFKSIEKD